MAAALRPPDPPLADGVIVLRVPGEADLGAIERGLRDPDVIRAFGSSRLSAEQVLELNRRRWREGEAATFAICTAAGDCQGHVFVNLGASGRATVGYWVLPEARQAGFATRAVRLVSGWCFENLGVARLGLLTEPWNDASRRVADRAGFRQEGVLRSWAEIDGRRVDYVSFSLLPRDLQRVRDP